MSFPQDALGAEVITLTDNEVLLRGRVRHDPGERELPSGDPLVTVRVVVPRSEAAAARRGVDWVDCSVWSRRLQRQVLTWREGDQVEVRGELRRRFFRSGGATGTLLEVELLGGKVLKRAARAEAG